MPKTGVIETITPTSMRITGEGYYVPPEIRQAVICGGYKIGDKIKITCTPRKELRSIELVDACTQDPWNPEQVQVPGSIKGSGSNIQSLPPDTTTIPAKTNTKTPMPMQEIPPRPAPAWMTESDRNKFIVAQSALARAIEVINAHYAAYPEILRSEKTLGDTPLEARCNLIEQVADRFYEYISRKVREGKT